MVRAKSQAVRGTYDCIYRTLVHHFLSHADSAGIAVIPGSRDHILNAPFFQAVHHALLAVDTHGHIQGRHSHIPNPGRTGLCHTDSHGLSCPVIIVDNGNSPVIVLCQHHHRHRASLYQLTVFILCLILAFFAVGFFVKPFRAIVKFLDRVAEGGLDEDIAEESYRETKQISRAINKTLQSLKAVDQSRQEFVSNVSHELKTPITSIRVLADSLMSMDEVPKELYQEFMGDISDEIDRESKIIDDLLTLVRMDKSSAEINITQTNINALVEMILKRLRPIARRRNIELIFESIREVTADIDEVKFSLAVNNLVENAVKYNREDGWVRVTLDADHKFFYIKVSDSGIGIPEEYKERVFERFYRVDKARSRETGGTGLGLAITKSVIFMHHGSIQVESKEDIGTTFTVKIPLMYIPSTGKEKP